MSQQPVTGSQLSSAPETAVPARSDPNHLVWLDMEMTGLDPDQDRIIEVAVVITDSELNVLTQSEALAVHQSTERLDAMDNWNRGTHGKSGLTDRVKASKLDEAAAEQAMIDFIAPWVPKGASPLCGNTVHQDRRFMVNYMPELESWFHYRNLDVSTIKELCKRWQPKVAAGFTKRGAHTALADILESVQELRYYREHFIGMPEANDETD